MSSALELIKAEHSNPELVHLAGSLQKGGPGSGPQKDGADNFSAGVDANREKEEASATKFPKGSKVKLDGKEEEVTGHKGNTIETTGGNVHSSKAIKA